jgi:diguanylate cyclase (GGDEF)-like protein/PAS domain S-box-containing protein
MRLPIGSYIAQNGEVKIVNPEFERTAGFSEDELLSLPTLSLVHADDRNRVKKWSVQMLKGERTLPYEYRAGTKDGRMRWIMETVTSIRFQGQPATLGCFLDITDRKEAEETIRTLAYYDPLTGLPNRILFLDRFNLALAQANRNHQEIALLTLDLDRFKEVNDTLGHSAGDQLLKEAGQRLASLLRKTDTIARMGGDEFMILLSAIGGKEDVKRVSRKILDMFQIPFHLEDQSISMTASIGIAVFPDDGRTADLLIKNSDRAMYRTKEAGRNNFQFYQPTPY